ncbi:MAG: CHAT domain-containing tetratricopeptide repeat protein [Saprospiraceae bacterium]|nr:CHAT domain-containing protein [Lewinella sp.]
MRQFSGMLFLCWCTLLPARSIDTVLIRQQFRQAVIQFERQEFATARSIALKARKALDDAKNQYSGLLLDLNYLLADCALETGNYPKALHYYLEIKDHLVSQGQTQGLEMAEALHKLGYYHQETKSFQEAITYCEQALAIRKKLLDPQHLKIADLYNNLGVCKNALGDHDKALEYYDQALLIRLQALPPFHPQIAQTYNNLGICMEQKGEYQLALSNYGKAMDQYRQLYGAHHLALADVYLNVGPVYQALGDGVANVRFLRSALEIYQQHLPEDHPSLALAYNNLANAYVEQSDFQAGLEMYQKALAIRVQHFGDFHPDVAQTYFNMGVCYFRQAMIKEAQGHFLHGMSALNYQPSSQPSFERVSDHYTLILTLYYLSELQKEQYRNSQSVQDLLTALDYYDQADLLIDFLRSDYETTGSKLALADLSHQFYDLAITLSVDLFTLTQERSYAEKAFYFSEKSKGLLLLDALNSTKAEHFAGVPDTLLSRIHDFEDQIVELEKERYLSLERSDRENVHQTDSLASMLFEKKQKLSALIKSLQSEYPEYYSLRYQTEVVSVSKIQSGLLAADQTLLSYFLGDEFLHLFVINRDGFEVVRAPAKEDLPVWISTLRSAIRRYPEVAPEELPQNIRFYFQSAFRLYEDLLLPVASLLKERVIIIPDGELGLIPFDALISSFPDTSHTFRDLAYLVKEYSISYNFSATLYAEMSTQKQSRGLKPYLGLAPAYESGNTNGLDRLQFNQAEVEAVKGLLGGTILSGVAATKTNFLSQQGHYKIIHLATHGKADPSNNRFSFLAFSETPATPGEAALLYVAEIYGLSCPAELVVLSACETGVGELQSGEGIASIARAFSYAGTQSLVATLWSIEDRATNDLIFSFFEKIRSGSAKDSALRKAKLDFIKAGGQHVSHPYFWAAFIPVGNMDQIRFGPVIPPIAGLIPVAVLFYIGLVRRRRKKQNRVMR